MAPCAHTIRSAEWIFQPCENFATRLDVWTQYPDRTGDRWLASHRYHRLERPFGWSEPPSAALDEYGMMRKRGGGTRTTMKGAELEAADGSMRRRSRGCSPVLRRSSRRFTDCGCTVPSSYTCRIPYSGAMLRHKSHPHPHTSQVGECMSVRVTNWAGAGGCHVLPSRMLWEDTPEEGRWQDEVGLSQSDLAPGTACHLGLGHWQSTRFAFEPHPWLRESLPQPPGQAAPPRTLLTPRYRHRTHHAGPHQRQAPL